MSKGTVLTVDDDCDLQQVLGQYLEDDGYNVVQALSGEELKNKLPSAHADVILLDLILPDTEGMGLIQTIRNDSDAAIIIVSGKSDSTEKIVCLEMGADDYMTKPFEMRELSARIKAVLRRSAAQKAPAPANQSESPESRKIKLDKWVLDRDQFQLYDLDGNSLHLTTGEFKLLEALVLSHNRALSREYLFELTRDGKFDAFDRAIDIQIGRIRKKMGGGDEANNLIKTVRGVGYMFTGNM